MDDATMNKLYGWKGRVHKAIKVFEQSKMDYVRVCALPNTRGARVEQILKRTSSNHDADIALTWVLMDSSHRIVDLTCDAYVAMIKNSFHDYVTKQDELAAVARGTSPSTITSATPRTETDTGTDTNNETTTDVPSMETRIEGVVENTVNGHIKFIEQWRSIVDDAQTEAAIWKNDHEQFLEMICKVDDSDSGSDDESQDDGEDDDFDSDDKDEHDGDSIDSEKYNLYNETGIINENRHIPFDVLEKRNSKLELLRKGMKFDKHANHLFELGTYVSAGKVLISSMKIALKLDSVEKAAQKSGNACIMGLTHRNLRDRQIIPSTVNNNWDNIIDNLQNAMEGIHIDQDRAIEGVDKSEFDARKEWKNQIDTTKLNAVYTWYRMYHGALTPMNTKRL